MFARKEGIGFRRAKDYIKREYDKVGEGRLEWYDIGYWFKRFGLGKGWKKLLDNYKHEIAVYPDVVGVLETLSQEYELVITSNSVQEFIGLEINEIRDYFTYVFSATSDFKQVKKTIEVYSVICEVLGIKPKEMVHVGDHWYFDFVIPKKLGITAFYLDRTEKKQGEFIVKDLEELCLRVRSTHASTQ